MNLGDLKRQLLSCIYVRECRVMFWLAGQRNFAPEKCCKLKNRNVAIWYRNYLFRRRHALFYRSRQKQPRFPLCGDGCRKNCRLHSLVSEYL